LERPNTNRGVGKTEHCNRMKGGAEKSFALGNAVIGNRGTGGKTKRKGAE